MTKLTRSENRSAIVRPSVTLPGEFLTIENDLGERPAGLGLMVKDPSVVSIVSLVAAGLAPIVLGPVGLPLSVAIAILGMNDCKCLHSGDNDKRAPGAIGPETRLNALPAKVAQSTVTQNPCVDDNAESPTLQGFEDDSWVGDDLASPGLGPSETALSNLLASPYTSRAIFGAQRTGKSYLAAVASSKMAANGTKVYHLNLASYGDEDSRYWQHATDSVRGDLSALGEGEANRLITKAVNLVKRFYADADALLIVDEWAYLGATTNQHADALAPLLKLLADKIATLSSTGMKRHKAIWTIAPEFVAGGLTQDAKAVKKLALCLVAIAPGTTAEWHGQAVGFSAELFSQIQNNYPITYPNRHGCDSDRIAYVCGRWLPVGVDGGELGKAPTPTASVAHEDTPMMGDALAAEFAKVAQLTTNDALECFRDWVRMQANNGHQTITFTQFKNASAFKKFGRSRDDWNSLISQAEDRGWLKTVTQDEALIL